VPELLNGPGGVESEELNATVMDWPPGHVTTEHVNAERDVLLVVLRGSAVVHVDDAAFARAAGEALVIEKGARRWLASGAEGVRVLTAHRRRPGLMPG